MTCWRRVEELSVSVAQQKVVIVCYLAAKKTEEVGGFSTIKYDLTQEIRKEKFENYTKEASCGGKLIHTTEGTNAPKLAVMVRKKFDKIRF